MEPLTIIFGVAVIFVAAYAADRNESARQYKESFFKLCEDNQELEEMNGCLSAEASSLHKDISRLEAFAPPERKPYEKKPWTWSEQNDMLKAMRAKLDYQEAKYEEMRKAYYDIAALRAMPAPVLKNVGQKPAEVIKIELGDDFKELKAAVDSLGSINVLKTELDRAHKREAIYMKRLLVSNAAILAASKKA